jgi:hypothetical protein
MRSFVSLATVLVLAISCAAIYVPKDYQDESNGPCQIISDSCVTPFADRSPPFVLAKSDSDDEPGMATWGNKDNDFQVKFFDFEDKKNPPSLIVKNVWEDSYQVEVVYSQVSKAADANSNAQVAKRYITYGVKPYLVCDALIPGPFSDEDAQSVKAFPQGAKD